MSDTSDSSPPAWPDIAAAERALGMDAGSRVATTRAAAPVLDLLQLAR